MSAILEGIKIIDLSTMLPGPLCTQVLGDIGADIIKIEEITGGDAMRYIAPIGKVDSASFLALNRNKRSVKLNLRTPEGKEILNLLVADADVLIEQFRPGVMKKLGLAYEDLKKINPRIIVCSISGYGQEGPYSQRSGHDINYLSKTGILDMIAPKGGKPVIPGTQLADIGGGTLWPAFSIMAALFAREKTGQGQYLDVSMTDAVFSFMTVLAGTYSVSNKLPRPSESLLSGQCAWYYVYKTKDDRYISLGMLEPKFWKSFCEAINRPDYIPQQMGPQEVQERMKEELQTLFITKTADEWMELLDPIDACASKVNTIAEALADEQLNYRGMIVEMDHPVEGKVHSIGFPVKFSDQPASVRRRPPGFGEHTDEVLTSLGYDQDTISKLHESGVI